MLVDPDLSFDKQTVTDTEHEVKRLHASFDSSKKELEVIKQHAVKSLGAEEAEVFEAHITILTDPELIGGIEQKN